MDETVRMLASKGIAQAPTADGLVCTNPLLPDGRCAILSDDDGRITVRLCRPGGSGPSRIVAGADVAGAVAGWLTGLAAARHSRGLTQAELAAAAGIAPRAGQPIRNRPHPRRRQHRRRHVGPACPGAPHGHGRPVPDHDRQAGAPVRTRQAALPPRRPASRGTLPRIPVGSGPVECVTHTRGHEHTRQ